MTTTKSCKEEGAIDAYLPKDFLYQSLMSTKKTRWRASELTEGVHQLAGAWSVYGSYHFIPYLDSPEPQLEQLYRINHELIKPRSGTLELKFSIRHNTLPYSTFVSRLGYGDSRQRSTVAQGYPAAG